MKNVSVMSTRALVRATIRAGGEDDGGGDAGDDSPEARGREIGEQHADGGEERGGRRTVNSLERAGRERREPRASEQGRLGGNLGPGAERQPIRRCQISQATRPLAPRPFVKRNLPGAPDEQDRAKEKDERGAGGDGERLAALFWRNS